MLGRSSFVAGILLVAGVACASAQNNSLPLSQIKLPPGFAIEIYATGVDNARQMTVAPSGVVFVGSRGAGKVYALVDSNKDNRVDRVVTIASGLNMPSGVTFRNGALYVAEINRVIRYDGIESKLDAPPQPVVVNASLPSDRHHGWKFIGFGPDGLLYVPIGAPCNICEPKDPYASITRMKPDGSGFEVFARGVRNSVGFDWEPGTGALWFTDNGRDMLGDDVPNDELNRAPKPGLHFGYPYCHAGSVQDPEFGAGHPCSQYTPPTQKLGPHVASIGMRFYTGKMFPEEYRNQIFIAEHGSWNRSTPIGYRISVVKVQGDKAVSYDTFAEGWLQGAKPWGRPADVLVMPDGALLVADDQADVIYRISYQK
jgi:glucose/arabinose dehydrogenase